MFIYDLNIDVWHDIMTFTPALCMYVAWLCNTSNTQYMLDT